MATHPADPHADPHAHAHAPAPAADGDGDDLPHHGLALAEPRSPAWLPLLGIALLAVVVVWWLSTPSEAEERAAAAAASASASASAASASATAAVASAQQLVPAPPRPTPAPIPNTPPAAGGPTFVKPANGKAQ